MNKHIPLFLVAAAILLPGCQKESPRSSGGLPMRVAPTLAGDTKGSMTTADLTDFYLQVDAGDPAFNYFEHASKSESGIWTTPTALLWKDEKTSVSYCAAHFGGYAFSAADFKNGVNLELPQDQSTQESLNAADLLTMHATTTFEDTTDGILPVALSHGLAKLTITLTLGEKFYENLYTRGANPVEDFTILGTNVVFSFNPQTGEISALEDTPGEILPLTVSFTPATAESKSATFTYEAILVPQDLGVDALKVIFCVGDYDYEWSNSEAITLEAGKSYDLTVSVTAAPPLKHAYVDMGNGLLWATCNVGANNPWDYGDYYAWGETTTKDSYTRTTYQWVQSGQPDIYHFTKYTIADGVTDGIWYDDGGNFIGDDKRSFAEYDYTDDAVRQNWGGNWRTPTDAEWSWLFENCTCAWQTDYNGTGVKGLLMTSNKNDNFIFLPAAGIRGVDDISVGSIGYYWSSDLARFTANAIHVYFDSGSFSAGFMTDRTSGQSIRPVHD